MSPSSPDRPARPAWWAFRQRRTCRADEPSDAAVVGGADAAEMERRFRAVALGEAEARHRRLVVRLQPLVQRAVPVRKVEAAPGLPSARIRFADGTTVVVRGHAPGDVGVLAVWALRASFPPVTCSTDADGVHLAFALPGGRRRLSVLVTGLDQPE